MKETTYLIFLDRKRPLNLGPDLNDEADSGIIVYLVNIVSGVLVLAEACALQLPLAVHRFLSCVVREVVSNKKTI